MAEKCRKVIVTAYNLQHGGYTARPGKAGTPSNVAGRPSPAPQRRPDGPDALGAGHADFPAREIGVNHDSGGGIHVYLDIYVTYRKERPRRRDRRPVRARACPLGLIPRIGLHRGRTHHMSLSAPASFNNPMQQAR